MRGLLQKVQMLGSSSYMFSLLFKNQIVGAVIFATSRATQPKWRIFASISAGLTELTTSQLRKS
jgi:hypothetical protein